MEQLDQLKPVSEKTVLGKLSCFNTMRVRVWLVASFVLIDQLLKTLFRITGKSFFNDRVAGFVFDQATISGFIVLTLIVFLLGVVVAMWIRRDYSLALGCVVAGGVSNVLDRLLFGGVTDYISIFHFYFNVADVLLWLGCVLVFFKMMGRSHR